VARDRRRAPLLVAIGIVVVAGGIGSIGSWVFFGGLPWGLALIALGILLWAWPDLLSHRGDVGPTTVAPAAAWPAPITDALAAPATDAPTAGLADPTTPMPTTTTTTLPPRVERLRTPRRRRYPVGPAAMLVTFAVVGALAGGTALDWWHTSILAGTITASLLLFVGAFLTGVINRRWTAIFGLLWFGAIASFLLTVRPNLDGGAGERTVRPGTVVEAETRTRMAAGRLTLDLTGVASPTASSTAGATTEPIDVRADLGFGQLVVDVPADAIIQVDATVGAGGVHLGDRRLGTGLRVHDHWTDAPAVAAGQPTGPTITLKLDVGAGDVRIQRVSATTTSTPAS
jgi:hypothetical protein